MQFVMCGETSMLNCCLPLHAGLQYARIEVSLSRKFHSSCSGADLQHLHKNGKVNNISCGMAMCVVEVDRRLGGK
jgi:hypothetical protein